MVMTLYGYRHSTSTQRVLVVLEETRTPYAFVNIDLLKGEHLPKEHLDHNLFGQIPCLHDGGLSISESRAIAWYIARKAGSALVPPAEDVNATARFQQAASIEAIAFDVAASEIAIQRVFKVLRGGTTDEARVQVLAASLEATIVGYERILGERKYLAGDTLSIVDLFHLSHGSMLAPQGFTWLEDEQRYPNVARWWRDISSRPSWREVLEGAHD